MQILELKNAVREKKTNSFNGLSSKMDRTKERVNDLEDRTVETVQSE
jgi:hypothetical protein